MSVVDPTGIPIHNDIVNDNRYGPAIPGIDILQSLSNFTGNCFLKDGLSKSNNQYVNYTYDPPTCDISDKLAVYNFQQDVQVSDIPSTSVPKLRILLKELQDLNHTANTFFQKREEQAVKILENGGTPDTEYSMRLQYMDRRHNTANSNGIALTLMIIVTIFTLFTGGYLYFNDKLSSMTDYILISLPITVFIVSILLGYIFITDYSLFLH